MARLHGNSTRLACPLDQSIMGHFQDSTNGIIGKVEGPPSRVVDGTKRTAALGADSTGTAEATRLSRPLPSDGSKAQQNTTARPVIQTAEMTRVIPPVLTRPHGTSPTSASFFTSDQVRPRR
jgi:hypothetical protein